MEELGSELSAPPRTSLCSCLKAGFSLYCLPFFKSSWYLWWEGKGNRKIIFCQILLNLCIWCRWPSSDTSSVVVHTDCMVLGMACLGSAFPCEPWWSHPTPLNPKHQHSHCFCWSLHRCFPQGFVDVWFCLVSLWHWGFGSTAAAQLRRLDPALVEETGRGNKSHVWLPLFFTSFLGSCLDVEGAGAAHAEPMSKRDTAGFQPVFSSANSSLHTLCLSSWQSFDDSPRELMNEKGYGLSIPRNWGAWIKWSFGRWEIIILLLQSHVQLNDVASTNQQSQSLMKTH